jgi:hypothetical protein
VCLGLPEAYEEETWAGTRWMVAKKNFAHVLMIDAGWPLAYARAAGSDGPLCVLTFRISAAATGALRFERPPFFVRSGGRISWASCLMQTRIGMKSPHCSPGATACWH